jgi:uncharacterized protein YggU (UPF0235/DUF167 family)
VGEAARPWKFLAGALSVRVRATPKGGRAAIDGIAELGDECVLKVRVRAAPTDGKANDGLSRLLAKSVGVAPTAVSLLQGAAGRLKTFRIEGDPATLAATLERATAQGAKRK